MLSFWTLQYKNMEHTKGRFTKLVYVYFYLYSIYKWRKNWTPILMTFITLLEFVIPNCGRQVLTALLLCSSLTETCAEVFPIESKKRFFRASSTVPTLTQSFLQISKTKCPQCHLDPIKSHFLIIFNLVHVSRHTMFSLFQWTLTLPACIFISLAGQKGCGELVLGWGWVPSGLEAATRPQTPTWNSPHRK